MENRTLPPETAVHNGLSTTALKCIAVVSMVMDHCTVFFPLDSIPFHFAASFFRWCGAVAMPLFVFCMVVGYHHTRNVRRYVVRLGLLALISYLPYVWFIAVFNGMAVSYLQFNIFFTLLLSLLALAVYHSKIRVWGKVLLIGLFVLLSIPSDGSLFVLVLMFAFDAFYLDHRRGFGWAVAILAMVALIFFLFTAGFWNDIVGSIHNGVPFFTWYLSSFSSDGSWALPVAYMIYSLCKFGGLLSLPLVCRYDGRRGGERLPRFSKWIFYVFYPVHLLLFVAIYRLFF